MNAVSKTTDISFINVAKTLAIFFVPLVHLPIIYLSCS